MGTALAKDRMQWVDAMRGFSMIIVVLGHVLLSMGIGGYSSFLSSVLLTFRMPLFFFVSGFFSYRLINWWTRSRVFDILKRKVQAQVLCTIIFMSVYQIVTSGCVGGGKFLQWIWRLLVHDSPVSNVSHLFVSFANFPNYSSRYCYPLFANNLNPWNSYACSL